ncbi:hypothetical protein QE152_g15273 [Popillia japonica]|uniref:Nuclease HARBI1 n=1 Tax=Popillia japonica TaxID=7064 RepID=A0AAW1L6A2_POPJA
MNVTEAPTAVPPIIRFFAALYFFATGSYQRTIGESLNIAICQQSASNAITEVTRAIFQVLGNEWIKFPRTIQEINRVKGRSMQATRFPGIVGAIDCTHIAILAPTDEEHNYVNRKGFHSKNVQMVVLNQHYIIFFA